MEYISGDQENISQTKASDTERWASVEGADVDNSGFIRFKKAPGDRGTEVKVVLEYNPPGGALASAFNKLKLQILMPLGVALSRRVGGNSFVS